MRAILSDFLKLILGGIFIVNVCFFQDSSPDSRRRPPVSPRHIVNVCSRKRAICEHPFAAHHTMCSPLSRRDRTLKLNQGPIRLRLILPNFNLSMITNKIRNIQFKKNRSHHPLAVLTMLRKGTPSRFHLACLVFTRSHLITCKFPTEPCCSRCGIGIFNSSGRVAHSLLLYRLGTPYQTNELLAASTQLGRATEGSIVGKLPDIALY